MTAVGHLESKTRRRVIALVRDQLGYEYPGDGRNPCRRIRPPPSLSN